MRIALVIGFFLLLGVFAATGSARTHATLGLADRSPLTIHGRGFAPSERVRVTVRMTRTSARTTRASRAGTFTVRFADLSVPRCGGVFATARGGAGSLATLKIPLPACQPTVQP